ncbi:oxidoreductase [Paenibacillus radicis (ex Xue et al. 2023)]|uniref:Oxidoreductase n=1 Tax=Paenibacillus radicis (ex Xue et al. 2023) TaxID=2972489 RepID=A0ABT1YAX8_9BACL|nr:oxidoreductase [Paenibacillus radicis (ex Xue et al. 2023)]MCR8630332.1 oxidoreductase [Paenibacillus radicis (ex Xue et al. 2023)]
MNERIRVGLIGYGFAGRTFHAPVIICVPDLKLSVVVERRTEASKERYPWVNVVPDVQQLYEDDTIDLVVVTTPSTDHYRFVKDALLAGKHVIVEKPFTTNSAEADELIDLAKEQGKVLSVFHNRRWDGDFLTIRELLKQELIGSLTECEFHWDRYNPIAATGRWRNSDALGAGVFYDLGVHFLDQALCLFGIPQTIRADIRIQREGSLADDYFDVTLGYESGLKVNLNSSQLVREPGPRYILHGTKGSFVKYGIDPQEEALKRGLTPASPGWGMEAAELWGKLNTSIGGLHIEGRIETLNGAYASYFQNVADHIRGHAELEVKPEQARTAIRLIELALQSSREQKTIQVEL